MTEHDKNNKPQSSTPPSSLLPPRLSSTPPSSLLPPPYLNRDLSWIDFNERVLGEGLRRDLPPLERFRFFSIVSSNFDEFFMVRVAALKRALRSHMDDVSLAERLKTVSEKVKSIAIRQYRCLEDEIFPALAAGGLALVRTGDWTQAQRDFLESRFMGEIYPILTPLRIEEKGPFPFIGGFSLNCAFLLERDRGGELGLEGAGELVIAVVQLPTTLDRIILLPEAGDGITRWTLLEDLVLSWGDRLFPGLTVRERMLFKVNRDADFGVDEERDADFIEAMEEVLEGRVNSRAIRMVYSPPDGGAPNGGTPDGVRDALANRLGLDDLDLYEISGPLNLGGLLDLVNLPGIDSRLREKPWPIYSGTAPVEEPLWDRIRAGDLLIHLPYQSFDPVLRFFQDAATDPDVIAIKTTLYRTSGNSPIIRALEDAALAGKHVTAVVELKARFDEERNISWANRLEKAGVIVVYGLARLKVHAKITLIMRRENGRIVRYAHLSTGNYNDRTAKLYEDIGLFTAREELAYDAGLLFNMITGYSAIQAMRRLSIAPTGLKRRLLELIDREIERTSAENPGRIMAKLNALVDTGVIDALYRASRAGVRIQLCVRGICCLVPGVAGLSEHIRVVSVVDHYLEHSRIIHFANGGAEEIYLSSADWMPRNLDRRVELMFPVQDEMLRRELREILESYFKDNCHARLLHPDGSWEALAPRRGEEPFRVQERLLADARNSESGRPTRQEFIVRRRVDNKN